MGSWFSVVPPLGKGYIQTVNRHSGPDGVCYGQFGVDSKVVLEL